jgi:hypothetical protein
MPMFNRLHKSMYKDSFLYIELEGFYIPLWLVAMNLYHPASPLYLY